MNLYQEFETNKSKEEGIRLEPMPGIFFTVKRAGGSNKAFSEATQKKLRPYINKYKAGKNLPQDIIDTVNQEAFVDHCLISWENVTYRDGTPMPYTKEAAKKLLADLPELFNILSEDAHNVENFKGEEEIPGKSLPA